MERVPAVGRRQQYYGSGGFPGEQQYPAAGFPGLSDVLHQPVWLGLEEFPGGGKYRAWTSVPGLGEDICHLYPAGDHSGCFYSGIYRKIFSADIGRIDRRK